MNTFSAAFELEQSGNSEAAIAVYEGLLKGEPNHAEACINLGSLYFHANDTKRAEYFYRNALEIDPNYTLAWFNLGTTLDEQRDFKAAIEAYLKALEICPTYADAHYNLAITYEASNQRGMALRHWRTYRTLDKLGPWSEIAKARIRRIVEGSGLALVEKDSNARQMSSMHSQSRNNGGNYGEENHLHRNCSLAGVCIGRRHKPHIHQQNPDRLRAPGERRLPAVPVRLKPHPCL